MSLYSKNKQRVVALEKDVEDAFQESEQVFHKDARDAEVLTEATAKKFLEDARAVEIMAESAAKEFLEVAMTHLRQLTKYTGAHTGALPFKVAQQDAAKFLADFDARENTMAEQHPNPVQYPGNSPTQPQRPGNPQTGQPGPGHAPGGTPTTMPHPGGPVGPKPQGR